MKKYPGIITKYASLTSPLSHCKNLRRLSRYAGFSRPLLCVCHFQAYDEPRLQYYSCLHNVFKCVFQDPVHFTITKTYLYNFDPLKPHFYTVKLGFTGVYIIFLISAQNVDCGYSLEPPRRGGSNVYPQSMFCAKIRKTSEFFIWKVSVFGDKIFLYIWIGVFS